MIQFKNNIYILIIVLIFKPGVIFALGHDNYVTTQGGKGYFTLSALGKSIPLYISGQDYIGVIRALKDLQTDINKVTGINPSLINSLTTNQKEIVIVGTIGKSEVLDRLIKYQKIDVTTIKGKWEKFLVQVVENPFPGVERALVIAGSDKRGSIYGIYDLSEQIGVSPWYWWADVPVEHKNALFVKPVRYTEGPSVKYRGIFINDEAPDLTNWIREKFGTVKSGQNPPIGNGVVNYGHEFYTKVFELLLRIKANYLWPAMWSNAFNEDDVKNPELADEYGIVMGTSHQEPMLRSQQEWDRRYIRKLGSWNFRKHADTLEKFWREGIRRNKYYV